MGLLSASLLAELQKPAPRANFVLAIATGAGTARLSTDGVSSLSLGYYDPWIIRWGALSRSLSNWRGGVQAVRFSVDVDDTGGQFTTAYGRDLRGRVVGCKIVSPGVTAASYFNFFVGVVDGISKRGNVLTLNLRQEDDPLEVSLTKAPIKRNTFSALPSKSDANGKGVPYLVGDHDSTALAALGMLELPYVDNSAFRYLVALGWWSTVVRVFVDGTLQADPGDYSVTQVLSGDSRKVTLVDFVTDQAEATVLADVQDLVSSSGPAACLLQLLLDLVWNDYHTASVSLTTEPLSSTHFTVLDRLLSTALEYGRSYYVPPERKTGQQVLKEFSDSYDVLWFWTYDGKLAPLAWDYRAQNDAIYLGPGAPDATLALERVLTDADMLSEPEHFVDAESSVNRLLGKSGLRAADGAFMNQRTVLVETDEQERAAELAMTWLPAAAESVGNVSYLTPSATALNVNWTAVGAATVWECVDDPPPGASDSGTTYVEADGGAAATANFRLDLTAIPEVVSIQSVTIWYEVRAAGTVTGADDDTIDPYLYIAATTYNGTTATGVTASSYTRLSGGVWTSNPNTTLAWTKTDLDALVVGVFWDRQTTVNKRIRVSQVYIEVSYTAAANVSPPALSVLSRRLNRYRVAPHMLTVQAPLEFVNLELGSEIAVQDSREGWGDQPWERRLHRVSGIKLLPSEYRVELTLEDLYPQLTSFWLWGKALVGVDGASAAGDGMVLLTPGSTVTVTRASPKNLDSPAGIGVQDAGPVVQILNNCWPSERYGTLIERERTNGLVRSSFSTLSGGAGSVPTGWTATSGTVASDATIGEQLFVDGTVTANVLLLTQNAADSRATGTTTASYTAGTFICVSIDRKSSSGTAGDGGSWRLVRNVDGNYWNDSTPGWQAGAVDNVLTPTTSWARFESNPFSVGAGNTTLTFSVVLLSTATAACTLRVGHVQIEAGEWVSSRIVTGAAAVTRAADQITFGNDKSDGVTTYYVHPNTRGTLKFVVSSNWNSSEVTAGTQFWLWRVPYSNGNRWELYYTVGTGWRFTARSGGVDVTATVNVAVVEGTEYTVYARWTSSAAERGKTSILTLVVDDGTTVTSADSATYTTPVFTAATSINFCEQSSTANRQWDGYVIEARVSPFCLSDAEMGI